MRRSFCRAVLALIFAQGATSPVSAQSFEVLGTRAAGMGGAFVGVADDATAVYWNPAGLVLGGSYFSLVLDNNQGKAEPEDIGQAGRRSASLMAFTHAAGRVCRTTRLSATTLTPTTDPAILQLERLTTHHAGVTVVQSVRNRFALRRDAEVGARLRRRRTRPGRGPR